MSGVRAQDGDLLSRERPVPLLWERTQRWQNRPRRWGYAGRWLWKEIRLRERQEPVRHRRTPFYGDKSSTGIAYKAQRSYSLIL